MADLSEDDYYKKADNLLLNAGQVLQEIFKQRWKDLTGTDWTLEKSPKEFKAKFHRVYKQLVHFQKEIVEKGIVEEWDITLFNELLLHLGPPNSVKNVEKVNAAIKSIKLMRNDLAHNGKKKLTFEKYVETENKFKDNLNTLGVNKERIDKFIEMAGLTVFTLALERSKELQVEGDNFLKDKQFQKALELYTEAIRLPNLPPVNQAILHEQRGMAYYNLTKENKMGHEGNLDFAKKDGEKVLELNENSWKGHRLIGLVCQAQGDLNGAVKHLRRAVAIAPTERDLKSDFDVCKILSGRMSREDHLDPENLPVTLAELVQEYNDYVGASISEELFLKLGGEGLTLFKGSEYVAKGHQFVAGHKVEQSFVEAAKYYSKAAKVGNADGMINLAVFYRDGKGVKQDIYKALELAKEAASKPPTMKRFGIVHKDWGVLAAQHMLGMFYSDGIVVRKDMQMAAYWYKKAAAYGYGNASNNLGWLYKRGEGVPQNDKMAEIYWKSGVVHKCFRAAGALVSYYLANLEPELAERYLEMAIELGHEGLKRWKGTVLEVISEITLKKRESVGGVEEFEKKFEKKFKLDKKGMTFKERMERVEKMKSPEHGKWLETKRQLELAHTNAHTTWAGKASEDFNYVEIGIRAARGSVIAEKMMKCLENTVKFVHLWDNRKEPMSNLKKDEVLNALYACCSSTEAHLCRIPVYILPELMTFLEKILKSKGSEKNRLDKKARLCFSFLSMYSGLDDLHLEIMLEGLKRYPKELAYHRMVSDIYGLQQNNQQGLDATLEALQIFPDDYDLLYAKATHLRMIVGMRQQETVRQAFKDFLEKAPEDHRMVPDAYYQIAISYSVEVGDVKKLLADEKKWELLQHYYDIAEVAEKSQISCYLPVDSIGKRLLEPVMKYKRGDRFINSINELNVDHVINGSFARDKAYLKNPQRIQMIKNHRVFLNAHENKEPFADLQVPNHVVVCISHTLTPKQLHKLESLENLKEIKLQEMNPTTDKIYKRRIITFKIIEDPCFGMPSINLIGEDENGDTARIYVYKVEQNEEARRLYGIGRVILIVDPYMRQALDMTNGIRVDDPNCIVHVSQVNDMCRYCGREDAQMKCGKCKKVRYCGKECQELDWKKLKHKLICC